jgi:GT2 family glycosyltransferase
MNPQVGVVLVDDNGMPDTLECLRSLSKQTYPHWFLVVVDNASAVDPCEEIRREHPGCDVIQLPANGVWTSGNNAGIRRCLKRHADFVVLLNNDTTLAPHLLERLVFAAQSSPQFEVIGPVIRGYSPRHAIQKEGFDFQRPDRPELIQRLRVSSEERAVPATTEVDVVNGCCMMATMNVFRHVGLIDERFFLVHEETDFCLRAKRAGFRCGVIGEALVWHKGSRPDVRDGRQWQRYDDARNLLFRLTKHSARPFPNRTRFRSLKVYGKHADAPREPGIDTGHPATADAVLDGIVDAFLRRFSPRQPEKRPMVRWVHRAFDWHRSHRRSCSNIEVPA